MAKEPRPLGPSQGCSERTRLGKRFSFFAKAFPPSWRR
jgi:hypothetical protein